MPTPTNTVRVNGPAARLVRELTGLDATTVARAAGITPAYLRRIERGEQPVLPRVTYKRLLAACQVSDYRVLLADPVGPVWPDVDEPDGAA